MSRWTGGAMELTVQELALAVGKGEGFIRRHIHRKHLSVRKHARNVTVDLGCRFRMTIWSASRRPGNPSSGPPASSPPLLPSIFGRTADSRGLTQCHAVAVVETGREGRARPCFGLGQRRGRSISGLSGSRRCNPQRARQVGRRGKRGWFPAPPHMPSAPFRLTGNG